MNLSRLVLNLPEAQREKLEYACANVISTYVEYKPGRYVGVYADKISYLIIVHQNGPWSEGIITNGRPKD